MAKVCRTCTQTITNEYFYLDGSFFASAHLLVKDVLQSCIPEMDLDLVPNSAICKNCTSALYIVYQFKTETMKNEEIFRSKEHIRVKNFEALTRNTLADDTATSDGENDDVETFELELDNLDELKTEIVYEEDIDDPTDVVEMEMDGFEVNSEENFHENIDDQYEQVQNEEDLEDVKVFDCLPMVPIPEKLPLDDELQNSDENVHSDSKDVKQEGPKNFHPDSKDVKQGEPKIDVQKFIQVTGDTRARRDVNRPYECTECNFRSDAKAGLIMHSRIHTGEKPFHCTKCSYRAKRKAHLEDHMKIHTGERPFRCTVCDKRFITKQILKTHALVHTGEKPYRCLQCNFRSRHKLTIANHVRRVHIGVPKKAQPSVCYVCGKCLSGPASLNTHMKIHTGVKSHLCELCGRYFREKGMLKNHLQVHTGEKPFTCTECNYTATRKAHLQEHMRTHNNHRKLLQCTICDKRYTTKALLRKHMKEEHQTEVKEEPSAPLFTGLF